MKKVFLHIYAVSVAVLLCLACSGDKPTVIPRGKLAKIYAEMLMIDQWAISETSLRRIADTSLVYEPIFQKYGFDTEDYVKSVEHYMHDPERYSRILRETSEIIDEKIAEVNEQKKAYLRQVEIQSFVTDFNIGEFYPYLSDEPYVHYYDSLAVEPDSGSVYRLVPIERADTLYDRLRMIIKVKATESDTLEADTLAREKESQKEIPIVKDEIKEFGGEDMSSDITELKVEENLPMKPARFQGSTKLIRHSKLDSLKLK